MTKSMKAPFTPFDFFSNIFPAILFCLGLLFLSKQSPSLTQYLSILRTNTSEIMFDNKWISYALIAFSGYIIIFCIGHALMVISSLFIDRLLIGKGLGYPYVRLFKLTTSEWKKFSSLYHVTICELSVVYPLVYLWLRDQRIINVFIFHLLLLFTVKLLVGFLRTYSKKSRTKKSYIPELLKYSATKANVAKWILRIISLPGYPAKYFFDIIRSIFNMNQFDGQFILNFKEIFKNKYRIDLDTIANPDASVFWLPYIQIHEKMPNSAQSLHFIRTLIYFSRHLSTSFIALFYISVCLQFIDGASSTNYQNIRFIGSLYLFIGLIFFIHYYNIYYTFYSKLTFRSFYTEYINSTNPVQPSITDG